MLVSAPVHAQTFPSRTVTILVPFPPGSTADLLPRAVGPLMAQSMGTPVLVENQRIGAIGAAYLAQAEPDSYLVMMAPTVVLAVHQWL